MVVPSLLLFRRKPLREHGFEGDEQRPPRKRSPNDDNQKIWGKTGNKLSTTMGWMTRSEFRVEFRKSVSEIGPVRAGFREACWQFFC